MKHPILLTLTLATSLLSAQDFGQRIGFRGIVPKQDRPVELNEVVVSTTLSGETYAQSTRTVSVITAKEIQELPVANINELLEYVAGVDMRQRGPLDVQADLGIRGGTFDQTLILVNGVRMNNPQTGHHNMNLPVPLALIERIEVVHGGAATAHGIGAMTGVVNIVLKTPQKKLSGGYAATTGQHNLLNSSFYVGKKVGKWGVQVGHQYQQTSGYIANTDMTNNKFLVQAQRDYGNNFTKGTIELFYAENAKSFGAQNFYTSAFPDQFEATTTRVFAANWRETYREVHQFRVSMNAVLGSDRFELYRTTKGLAGFDASEVAYDELAGGIFYRAYDGDTAASWYGGPNVHATAVYNLNGSYTRQWNERHRTSVGMNQRIDALYSNALGTPTPDGILRQGYALNNSDGTYDMTWMADHRFTTERLILSAALMTNYHWSGQDTSRFFGPAFDFLYRLTPNASLTATANRSMRYPTYTDLYYNRGGAQGSLTLQPETAWNFDAGYKVRMGSTYLSASLFHRRSRDLIDWVTYPGDPTAYAQNITALNMTGLEGGVRYLATGRGSRKATLQRAQASVIFAHGRTPAADFSSLYALDYLQAKVVGTATQRLGLGLFATYALTLQDRSGTFMSAGEEVAYAPFLLADLKVYYAPARGLFKRQFPFQAFVSVNNAFNTTYYDRGGVIQPGRWISTGFEFRFR